MKKLLIFTIAFGFTIQLKAQNAGSTLYLMPATQLFPFGNINNALARAGLPETPMTFGSGAGGFGSIGNWRVGGEGIYFSGDASRGTDLTSLSGGLGYFYGAYVWQRKKWNIVPAAGIGFGGLTLNATRASSANSIGELIGNAANSSTVSLGDGITHTSLGIERNISDAMFIGVKASYNMGLGGNREWKTTGLTNSVSDSFNSFQLSLSIGFVLK